MGLGRNQILSVLTLLLADAIFFRRRPVLVENGPRMVSFLPPTVEGDVVRRIEALAVFCAASSAMPGRGPWQVPDTEAIEGPPMRSSHLGPDRDGARRSPCQAGYQPRVDDAVEPTLEQPWQPGQGGQSSGFPSGPASWPSSRRGPGTGLLRFAWKRPSRGSAVMKQPRQSGSATSAASGPSFLPCSPPAIRSWRPSPLLLCSFAGICRRMRVI